MTCIVCFCVFVKWLLVLNNNVFCRISHWISTLDNFGRIRDSHIKNEMALKLFRLDLNLFGIYGCLTLSSLTRSNLISISPLRATNLSVFTILDLSHEVLGILFLKLYGCGMDIYVNIIFQALYSLAVRRLLYICKMYEESVMFTIVGKNHSLTKYFTIKKQRLFIWLI